MNKAILLHVFSEELNYQDGSSLSSKDNKLYKLLDCRIFRRIGFCLIGKKHYKQFCS